MNNTGPSMSTGNEPRRIALVGCGKAKRPERAAARDLYTSTLFRLSRAFAERAFDGWYILSARHELVTPHTVLEPYDWSLSNLDRRMREGWVERVAHRIALEERGAHFTLLAGGHYRGVATHLRWTMIDAYIGPLKGLVAGVDEPLEGLGLGKRLAWLKARCEELS